MSNPPVLFSIVPVEVWRDKRLTLEMTRVLGALLSFRGKDTNTVWPSRQRIAERCGMSPSKISEATSALARLGWLTKVGRGGFSRATRYTITVPNLVAESVTVPQSATIAFSATGMRVPESATGIELTNNKPQVAQAPSACPEKSKARKTLLPLRVFLEGCQENGVMPIPEDDPIFAYAKKVGISDEMLFVAWQEFKARYLHDESKRQKDWRAHFRNAVRQNWYRLWYLKEGENAQWTTAGEQGRRDAT